MGHHGVHDDPSSDDHTDMVETIGASAKASEEAHRIDPPDRERTRTQSRQSEFDTRPGLAWPRMSWIEPAQLKS